MKKILAFALAFVASASFAASINWGTTTKTAFAGSTIGGVEARLLYIGASDLSEDAKFTITATDTLASLANKIGTDTESTASSTASGMLKGKLSGTYTFDSGLNDGDYVAILLSYTSGGKTYFNLSQTVATAYNAVVGAWEDASAVASFTYSGGSAEAAESGSLTAGGGWTAVPEPSTAALALAGLALLLKRRKA